MGMSYHEVRALPKDVYLICIDELTREHAARELEEV